LSSFGNSFYKNLKYIFSNKPSTIWNNGKGKKIFTIKYLFLFFKSLKIYQYKSFILLMLVPVNGNLSPNNYWASHKNEDRVIFLGIHRLKNVTPHFVLLPETYNINTLNWENNLQTKTFLNITRRWHTTEKIRNNLRIQLFPYKIFTKKKWLFIHCHDFSWQKRPLFYIIPVKWLLKKSTPGQKKKF